DDGNTTALDGCDPLCRLEQVVRVTNLSVLPPTEGCTNLDADPAVDNNLGGALSPQERTQFNDFLLGLITNGDLIALGLVLDLDDVLGQNDPMVRVAVLSGIDASPPFDQTRGEQFLVDRMSLDASGMPLSIIAPGALVGGALTSGPGN